MKNILFILALILSKTSPAHADSFMDETCPERGVIARAGGHESSGGRLGARNAVVVRFASGERGVDTHGYEALLRYIHRSVSDDLSSGRLVKMLNRKWGSEGESVVCLEFKSSLNATQAYDEIKSSVCGARNPLKKSPEFKRVFKCLDEVVDQLIEQTSE